MLDVYMLPLNLAGGQEEQALPGLLAAKPGKKTERSRAGDIFIVLLTPAGEDSSYFSPLAEGLPLLAATYFRTRGSVTTGLQAAAEELNKTLLKFNLSQHREEGQAPGLVNLVVLRRDQLYIANFGPTHTLLLNEERIEDFHEPVDAGRGLGISRAIQVKFYRAQVQANDLLLLCANLPQRWTKATFRDSTKISLDNLRRRLISEAGAELGAALMQFKPGEGEIHFLKPRVPGSAETSSEVQGEEQGPATERAEAPSRLAPQAPPADPPPDAILPPPDIVEPTLPAPIPVEETLAAPSGELPPALETLPPQAAPTPAPLPFRPARRRGPAAATPLPPAEEQAQPPEKPAPKMVKKVSEHKKTNWKRKFADGWLSFRADLHRTQDRVLRFAGRLLPGSTEQGETISSAKMLLIAVLVPLVIVAIATSIYLSQGRGGQHQTLLESAQQSARLAEAETDSALRLNHWAQTIHWLDQADEFGQSEQSLSLRREAQAAIDEIDGIIRLNFEPILVDTFNATIHFTKIDSAITDVYLLDEPGSRILRLYLTGKGYAVDADFKCGSLPTMGKLVDFVPLPPGHPLGATILAADGKGNTIYCGPDLEPSILPLIPPDNFSWGGITHITLDGNLLYVLDPEKNGLWVITAATDDSEGDVQVLNFSEYPPRGIFTTDVPKLTDVIDIAVNGGGESIFLLHEDGQMTLCNTSYVVVRQTNCTNPANYNDSRPGKEAAATTFPGAAFSHILTTQPPEPSLYILDAGGQTINQFSLQLRLRRQLRPKPNDSLFLTNARPTAFTITNTREAFLAFGNLLYQATLP